MEVHGKSDDSIKTICLACSGGGPDKTQVKQERLAEVSFRRAWHSSLVRLDLQENLRAQGDRHFYTEDLGVGETLKYLNFFTDSLNYLIQWLISLDS